MPQPEAQSAITICSRDGSASLRECVVTSEADLDWRLTVKFESKAHAHGVFSALTTHASAALAANRLKDGVVAQHDAEWLRIYAPSDDALGRVPVPG